MCKATNLSEKPLKTTIQERKMYRIIPTRHTPHCKAYYHLLPTFYPFHWLNPSWSLATNFSWSECTGGTCWKAAYKNWMSTFRHWVGKMIVMLTISIGNSFSPGGGRSELWFWWRWCEAGARRGGGMLFQVRLPFWEMWHKTLLRCEENPRCRWFTFDQRAQLCYLKSGRGFQRARWRKTKKNHVTPFQKAM